MSNTLLHPDRLFPSDKATRDTARELYQLVKDAPIISPHGHTDPQWFADNASFGDPVSLLVTPDHYILRMLYGQGLRMEDFGVRHRGGAQLETDKRKIWKHFATHFHLFRGTPSALWLGHVFHEIFSLDRPFSAATADEYFDAISAKLSSKDFLPRALYDRFRIEVLATTDAATDTLAAHLKIQQDWGRRVIPTYRPDASVDPEHEDFSQSLTRLSELTGEDAHQWKGYLAAHRKRRHFFKQLGATATDHGHPTAATLALSDAEGEQLFKQVQGPGLTKADAERFRAHMLWRMAEMSVDDGLVMQLHPGSWRNHNPWLYENFGRDKGADIPVQAEFTRNLKPLLDAFGNSTKLRLVLFTLDETTYSRELAPLAGHYPALRLGPAWWFHDSPEGMLRHRQQVTETAGFYNVTGFIDDTRAFFSIPARHDVARRIDARLLATWVAEHRLTLAEARDLIVSITGPHARECFRL